MKNTLSISIGEQCHCECLDCINDGENSIYVWVNVPKEDTSPKIDIYKSGVLIGSKPLESDLINNVKVLEDFTGFEESQVKLQYISNERKGKYFYIQFPKELDGDLMLKQQDEYFYNAKFTLPKSGSYELPPATTTTLGGVIVGDNIDVQKDGTISCPKITELENEMQELFTSVSNGKKAIASAITDKGVPTENDATFSQMAENILNIPTGGSSDIQYPDMSEYTVLNCTGIEFNEIIKTFVNSGYETSYDTRNNSIIKFQFEISESTSGEQIPTVQNFPKLYAYDAWDDNSGGYIIKLRTTAKKIIAPMNCQSMFEGFRGIQGEQDFSWLDTRFTVFMSSMFAGFGYDYMTKLNLGTNFFTVNVMHMEQMFDYCGRSNMTELNLGDNFATGNVENMSSMFMGCGYSKMTQLDLGEKFKVKNSDVIAPSGNFFYRNQYYPLTVYCTQDTSEKLTGMSGITTISKYE